MSVAARPVPPTAHYTDRGRRPSNQDAVVVRQWPDGRALLAVAVPLGIGIIKSWWLMCRVVRIEGAEHLDAALAKAKSLVPCYWHQHQLFCGKYLVEQRPRGLEVGWLISPSVDGEIIPERRVRQAQKPGFNSINRTLAWAGGRGRKLMNTRISPSRDQHMPAFVRSAGRPGSKRGGSSVFGLNSYN